MKNNKRFRKWIILPLCAGLIVSLISPGTTGFAEAVVEQFKEVVLGKAPTDHIIQVPDQEPDITVAQNDQLDKFKGFTSQEEVVHQSNEIMPELNPTTARTLSVDMESKDLFNLSQEQMENFLSQGYSIEDLYQLDELSNRVLIDPQTVAARKESDITWTELEKTLMQEKEAAQLISLSKVYSQEYIELQKEDLKDREMLLLLISYDAGKGTISELLKVYKSKGEPGLANYESPQQIKIQSKGSKSSQPPVDDDVLKRIQTLADETGIPIDDLLSQYHTVKDLNQHVFMEKE